MDRVLDLPSQLFRPSVAIIYTVKINQVTVATKIPIITEERRKTTCLYQPYSGDCLSQC